MCSCLSSDSDEELRLTGAIYSHALLVRILILLPLNNNFHFYHEYLKETLREKDWYSREDFTVQLQDVPLFLDAISNTYEWTSEENLNDNEAHTLFLQLWENLLQPNTVQEKLKNGDVPTVRYPNVHQPFLRTEKNSPSKMNPSSRRAAPAADTSNEEPGANLSWGTIKSTHRKFKDANQPTLQGFGLGEETGGPRGNPYSMEEFVRNVLEVKRVSDRVMSLKLEIEGVMLNVVSGYAPQVGCELEEKERFWSELDELMESIPTGERVVIGADFNGHVAEGNTGDEEVMGKFGVKERNLEGQMVVDFAKRMDMAVVNTYFQKREEHRVTYKSGGRRTQVDYILCRRGNLKEISDCKVVVGESVARQHRMVVCRMTLMVCKKKRSKIEKKTKWWKLKKEECCEEFRQKLRQALGGQVVLPDDWETTAEVIRETGRKVLGVSSVRRKEDKETWWWNEEVQDSVQRKRLAKKKWDMDRTEENRQEYKELQCRVKREVSKAKQKAYDELYTRLDTREGEKDLYRLARQRDRDGKDAQQVRVIMDRDGRVLTSEESVQRRWKEYFEELMNEENEREKRVEGVNSVEQKVDKIRKDKVRKALKRMKSGKAVGPDDIPVEVWKCLGEAAVEFLTSLFNRVLESEKMPEEWRRSVLVPIFKNKGDVQSCSNYRGIKLMSHTMKLWERVVEARLRKVVEICEQQYGFMPRKSTTDAIFALRILMEKYRDGQRELHCVFVDLEKAYDRVPREELWYCMRKSGVAEKYVRVVQDMYERSRTVVRCAVGQTEEFKVEVGLHQGSALSPFLFAIVMDQLSEEVRQESPWTMMFADDIVICSESREQVEENLERWRFALERRGMKVSRSKTEYMCVNEREGSGTVRLQGEEVKKVQEFKYLGSTVQSNGEYEKEVTGTEMHCDDMSPSNTIPTSVHAVRPADIRVVGAVGDSLTAGNGVASTTLVAVLKQYRGLSWSIGGDNNLSVVTTLPNIMREFNPELTGFSVGTGKQNTKQAFLNQAVAGAKSTDILGQVKELVKRMKTDDRINFYSDWKVITMFIGGNDFCDSCKEPLYYSPENFLKRIQVALDYLHSEVPRAIVNLVEPLHIIPLRAMHQDATLGCPTWLVRILCSCVVSPEDGSEALQNLEDLNRAYQSVLKDLVESGRYDIHSNFTVVLQPLLRDIAVPMLDGRPDSSFFSPDCFHLSQKAHTVMARSLWNNMMEDLGNKTYKQDFSLGLQAKCPSQISPFLQTFENSNYTYKGPLPPPPPISNWGSDFSCTDTKPSINIPSSVHRLRPADIKVIAALGDSVTAALGTKSKNYTQFHTEYKGMSWSIGGDHSLDMTTTLPNILRQFNPSLQGFSTGDGMSAQEGFNMAVSGATASDLVDQVNRLIQALKSSESVDFETDWKLITVLIGVNDLCKYCMDKNNLSPQNYSLHLMEALDQLYKEVPRVLVNVLTVPEIEALRMVKKSSLGCSFFPRDVCPCLMTPADNSSELIELKLINQEYQTQMNQLISGERYDGRENFTVVLQPYLQNTTVPLDKDGNPDLSYFTLDCFHLSERAQAEMAISLWNNMLEPVGNKQTFNNFTYDRTKLRCPSETLRPFIYTKMNSHPDYFTTPEPTFTSTSQPQLPAPCPNGVPVWVPSIFGVIGLLLGLGVMCLFMRRWNKKLKSEYKMNEMEAALKGTSL
ncbi:hypothetical protein QTP70_021738 [Hemibagrus guttatus]|uniref:ribonuclease H n=1 Tax=Hemibagrus guttatus TaxID=175788 RepID=A0AAE0Q8W5_9TELE|nr:hypothetical protein QTP70_021738 [Hemibagrus guttatus]